MSRSKLFLTVFSILTACGFTISEDKMEKTFKDRELVPTLQRVQYGERSIHYAAIDQGKDNLLVFVHGSPGSWNAFIDYFKNDSLLARSDMISIDRPGFGESDRGWPEPSIEAQARMMQAVTGQFPHKYKILVGHSLGGPVIARMAMDFPDDYQGLLFLAPSIDPEMEKDEWYRSLIKSKVGGWFTPGDFWVSNEEIASLKVELTEMIPLWQHIKAKGIVIQGTKDMLVPRENAEFARSMMPDSLLEVRYIERANHFIPWSHAEEVLRGVFDLLGD